MAILHYIDNEVAGFGEWTSVVENGGSTCRQIAAAAFPERGSLGARVTISRADSAYLRKETGYAPAAGEAFWVAWWMRINTLPGSPDYVAIMRVASGGMQVGLLYVRYDGRLGAFIRATANVFTWLDFYLQADQWNYFAVRFVRSTGAGATDGGAVYYLNGAEIYGNLALDTDARYAGAVRADLGVPFVPSDGTTIDFDEVKLADDSTAYPEPYVPAAVSEYPEARRTVVLYRMASADSREFADYCVTRLGIPRSNVCGLPNASGNEDILDQAACASEIETDLSAYLTRMPTVAAQATTFLLGYGLPGYYADVADRISIPTRLMRLGLAAAKQTDNPFYQGSGRISASDLAGASGGRLYLSARIDADSLAGAKGIVDSALRVAGLSALTETDYLLADQAAVRTSLAAQRTRLLTAASYTSQDAAVVIGDVLAIGSTPDGGSRCALVDTAGLATDTLRSRTNCVSDALIFDGWAAGLGFSQLPADGFDHEAFLEALLAGATFAEAVMRSIEHLEYTAVPAGSPLTTVAFALGGYNVYHGLGGPEAIDWTSPVACARADVQQVIVPLALIANQQHILAARAVSSGGIEEHNTHVLAIVTTDEGGALLPPPLSRPTEVTATVVSGNAVLVGFSLHRGPGMGAATALEVLTDHGTGVMDMETPAATIDVSDTRQRSFQALVTAEVLPARFAVRARKNEQIGLLSPVVTVRAPQTPPPPTIL